MPDLRDRICTHTYLAKELDRLSDEQIAELVERSSPFHSGTGGTSAVAELNGTSTFIKMIPLTELELESNNYLSTRNLFNLPLFFQYGVGSPGFGAWRELKAHQLANEWVMSGHCPNFPLMYHWRILSRSQNENSEEQKQKLERRIAYWEGSSPVRARYEGLHSAPKQIALFLEYFPQDLSLWIETQFKEGAEGASCTFGPLESKLNSINQFLEKSQFLHFDSHFKNILTDGNEIYFSDFGLAISSQFELSMEERTFFQHHRLYDFAMSSIGLVYSIIASLYGRDSWGKDLESRIAEACDTVPTELARILNNHAPAALVMSDFFGKLRNESKLTPFPAEKLEQTLKAECGEN